MKYTKLDDGRDQFFLPNISQDKKKVKKKEACTNTQYSTNKEEGSLKKACINTH